jgi:hypothetical protein
VNSLNKILLTRLLVSLIAILIISGCASNSSDVEDLSKSYKQNHDYESLVSILPHLSYTMTRSEVEGMLGKPTYCPMAHQCYYHSNQSAIVSCANSNVVSKQTCASYNLTLVVNYYLSDKVNSSPRDVMALFSLTPIGE